MDDDVEILKCIYDRFTSVTASTRGISMAWWPCLPTMSLGPTASMAPRSRSRGRARVLDPPVDHGASIGLLTTRSSQRFGNPSTISKEAASGPDARAEEQDVEHVFRFRDAR